MQLFLLRFLSWLGQKLLAAVLIVAIALAGYGLWLFLQEEGMLERSRLARLQEAVTRRDQLLAAQSAVIARLAAARAEIEAQRNRVKQAEKVIASLRQLESWWQSWWPWSEQKAQQAANAEQLRKLETLKLEATGRWTELQRQVTEIAGQQVDVEQSLGRVQAEIGQLEASRSRARHYVLIAWERTKW